MLLLSVLRWKKQLDVGGGSVGLHFHSYKRFFKNKMNAMKRRPVTTRLAGGFDSGRKRWPLWVALVFVVLNTRELQLF